MMAAPDDITGPINLGNPVETSVAELAAADHRADRLALEDRASAVAGRRPDPALPRHLAGQGAARLGAAHAAAAGPQRTIAYFDELLGGSAHAREARGGRLNAIRPGTAAALRGLTNRA